jgi:uncharacterized membrane protein
MFPSRVVAQPFLSGGFGLLILAGFTLVVILLVVALVDLYQRRRHAEMTQVTTPATPVLSAPPAVPAPFDPAEAILRERFARGEIDLAAFEAARTALGHK